MSEQVRAVVVIFGCLSDKAKDEESIPSQIARVEERLGQVYPDGYVLVGVFTDDGVSGSKRNRGPGLQAAIDAATTAADEHGACELWANTSARFARGTGKKHQARSLLELFTQMNRVGVALRSVNDDYMLREELVGVNSRMAAKYSEDLSESVTRAKRRQAEAGRHLGGPLPDGWVKGDKGDVQDPDRAPVIAHMLELADQGMPDSAVARRLNSEGYRTRAGRPWDRRAVQNHVTNPWHAGRVVHHRGQPDEQTFDGHHKPIVDPEVFDRIQARRPQRDLGAKQHKAGAPARRHLLAKLAVCGGCGSPMYAFTSAYRRKDGGRQRQYQCRGYSFSDGTCSIKVDAEAIDAAVLENLHSLVPAFDQWIESIEDRHAADRARLVALRDRELAGMAEQAAVVAKVERRWVEADDDTATTILPMVERERQALADAGVRVEASEGALASIPEAVSHDRLFDFASQLRDVIAGKVAGGRGVEQINRALLELFDCFVVYPPGRQLPEGIGLHAGAVMVEPSIRSEVAQRLLDTDWPAPPMEWVEALRYSGNTQE